MKATVRSGRSMGSPLRLTVPGLDDREADAAWAIVAAVFANAEAALTRFDGTSSLSRLNRAAGHRAGVPPLLVSALVAAWRAYRVTDGRFDPRIIGALEAAGERAGVDLPPSPLHLAPGEHWLALDARREMARVAAPVDLGGIGKGLALRWSAGALRRAGHRRFLLTAGGDVVAAGRGPADRPWVVGIEDPAAQGRCLTTLELTDAAVATSSTSVRSWRDEDDRPQHHLIEPATLEPATITWCSVTVVDPDPAWAEVRAKVGFLAGDGIRTAIGRHRAWWVDASGQFQTNA
jgi:thiamine biosynthesis lipoprotein